MLQSSSSPAPLPKVTGKLDHSFGLAYACEAAAALAAVDKAFAQDTTTLDLLLDARRNVRPDCAGKQLSCSRSICAHLRRAA